MTVVARNPHNSVNVSRSFHVQRAPGLVEFSNYHRLDDLYELPVFETVLGNTTEMSLSPQRRDVKFDWDMGDQTQYIDAGEGLRKVDVLQLCTGAQLVMTVKHSVAFYVAGPNMNHTYTMMGRYTVNVIAYNRVGRSRPIEAIVVVLQHITGLCAHGRYRLSLCVTHAATKLVTGLSIAWSFPCLNHRYGHSLGFDSVQV